ncbi:hypothetical protein [Nocardioides convexus]|uniref:hypothetical protein n=1 Tax=Nocardioides convexus TaxID=2712224 RepID=UPI00241815CC|nr:hypothetical protein [Nocardioides convexus]
MIAREQYSQRPPALRVPAHRQGPSPLPRPADPQAVGARARPPGRGPGPLRALLRPGVRRRAPLRGLRGRPPRGSGLSLEP